MIRIRCPDATGIDLSSTGEPIDVPMMFWRLDAAGVDLTINGRPQHLALPVAADSEQPPLITPAISADAYLPAENWHPGASARSRKYVVLFAIGAILIFIALRTVLRDSRWLTPVLLATGCGLAIFFAASREMLAVVWKKEVVVNGHPIGSDVWHFFTASSEKRVEEWWRNSHATVVIVPRSPEHLRRLDPVFTVNPDMPGMVHLSFIVRPDDPAAVLERWPYNFGEHGEAAPEFVRRVYGRESKFEAGVMELQAPTTSETTPSGSR